MGVEWNIQLQTLLYILTFSKVYIILTTLASHTKYRKLEAQIYW